MPLTAAQWHRLVEIVASGGRASLDTSKDILKALLRRKRAQHAIQMSLSSGTVNKHKIDERSPHFLIPDYRTMRTVQKMRKEFEINEEKAAAAVVGSGVVERLRSWIKPPALAPESTPRVFGNRICIVGLHGWVPTKVLQTVVGVPKGTSARLCTMMSENVREFFDKRPLAFFEDPPQIDLVPLEGQGCIDDRVNLHFAQLDDPFANGEGMGTGRDLIGQATTVLFVAHSQGAAVAALLAERMIERGIIRPKEQNIGMLSLAGVFHGPLPPLENNVVVKYVEADAARELFSLNDPHGDLSTRVQRSLTKLLANDAVFACIGSWLDQVVPLYSSTMLGIDHPNIWRSLYIDSFNYRADFPVHLFGFILDLVNARIEGARELLAQLSNAVEGSLYQSNAHSTLYNDNGVFQVLMHWMLYMDRRRNPIEARLSVELMRPRLEENPFHVPWTLRGILSNPKIYQNENLVRELTQLKRLFVDWRPDRKIWSELKLQLDLINSKL